MTEGYMWGVVSMSMQLLWMDSMFSGYRGLEETVFVNIEEMNMMDGLQWVGLCGGGLGGYLGEEYDGVDKGESDGGLFGDLFGIISILLCSG